jgi:hypothetical protein
MVATAAVSTFLSANFDSLFAASSLPSTSIKLLGLTRVERNKSQEL